MPPSLPTLTERHDGFDYGYSMNGACGDVSYLSAEDYIAGANGSHMPCEHCDESIHFGPAVAALRDRDDPALRHDRVTSFAWYHTSTSPDWPSPDFATRFEQELSWTERDFGITRERFIAEHTSKALHVGTYETAIENMLRRMKNQRDGGSQFYLYRVALCLDPQRINPGYRDENHEVAADISVNDLDDDDLDAVRYLNVHEAMGVLSLAVRPEAIAAVQCIPIPKGGLTVPIDPELFQAEINAVRKVTNELADAEFAAESIDPRALRMMQFGARPDPKGLAKRVGALQLQFYDCWHRLEGRLGELCLPNVSTVVRGDFNDAIAHWRGENSEGDVMDFVRRYCSMAALLERSSEVIKVAAQQPWIRTGRQTGGLPMGAALPGS